jgi:hypothetical protein
MQKVWKTGMPQMLHRYFAHMRAEIFSCNDQYYVLLSHFFGRCHVPALVKNLATNKPILTTASSS